MSVIVHHGDSREVLRGLGEASIDSVVCDPPYALVSIGKRFGADNAAPAKVGKSGAYARASRGFMGQRWDNGETAFDPEFWAVVLRVLKPGGHLIAFGGTRTYHRLACAIEDAGFEMRDMIAWLYGSGFPKSHDVSKGIDKAAGATREAIGVNEDWVRRKPNGSASAVSVGFSKDTDYNIYAPATDAARKWEGWGTALKPALEPIVLARKPLGKNTVAANVLQHGTGALNIDASRIDSEKPTGWAGAGAGGNTWHDGNMGLGKDGEARPVQGRWPANVITDGSEEVVGAFPDTTSGTLAQGVMRGKTGDGGIYGDRPSFAGTRDVEGSSGSAARFFYAVEKDAHCDLCRALLLPERATESPCNANTAEPPSSTQSTLTDAIARAGATGSPQPAPEGKSRRRNARATSAESGSSGCLQPDSGSVPRPAPISEASSLANNVRSAASLCGSCETAIAQSLAATQRGQSPASLPCPASIDAHSWQILTSSLALHVAGRESTDTTTTIPSLKMLLGSVFHAIGATTRQAKSEALENTESGPKRFHYSSKADAADRCGSKHPTVKPVDLMAYLCRLVTPPGGVVLDPFAGSGTTGMACLREGFDCILIEREAQYVADINRRIAHVAGEDAPLFAGSAA